MKERMYEKFGVGVFSIYMIEQCSTSDSKAEDAFGSRRMDRSHLSATPSTKCILSRESDNKLLF